MRGSVTPTVGSWPVFCLVVGGVGVLQTKSLNGIGFCLWGGGGRLPAKGAPLNKCVLGRLDGLPDHSFLKELMLVLSGGLVAARQANVSNVGVLGRLGRLSGRTEY